ncbi:hypothetical protein HOD38_05250 [archaeon]|nr:hypothetical protein [archaeon]MBT4397646.1 hypothetical protein [archaeon]MBT4441658.1 hypothetical protein [archaeon]
MKKIIIGILFMLVLCVGFVMAQTCYSGSQCPDDVVCNMETYTCWECIDTDGQDPYTKGTLVQGTSGVTQGYYLYTDDEEYCVNDYEVREYYCPEGTSSSIRIGYNIDCSLLGDYVCYDGACVYDGIVGNVDAGVALVGDEIEQSFLSMMGAYGVEALDVSNMYSCKDTDVDENDVYSTPGKVACFGPILNSAVVLVDGCRTEGRRVFLREYFAEDCADCDEYEILTGEYTINIYYEDYFCGLVGSNQCLTDDNGAAYCESAQNGGGQQAVAQEPNWVDALRATITGGIFF